MIIIGIDPGTRITGYAVIKVDPIPIILDFGAIKPPLKLPLEKRYQIIFDSIESLILQHKPSHIAVESQFVAKNPQSAIKLGMAKGMVFLAAAKYQLKLTEYTPKKAKLAVTGKGGASKLQVQRMIQALYHLPCLPEPEDAADALAIATCCAHDQKKGDHYV